MENLIVKDCISFENLIVNNQQYGYLVWKNLIVKNYSSNIEKLWIHIFATIHGKLLALYNQGKAPNRKVKT